MSEIAEFFHMGGYAFYVWTSYAVALVVLLANVLWAGRQHRRVHNETLRRASRRQADAHASKRGRSESEAMAASGRP